MFLYLINKLVEHVVNIFKNDDIKKEKTNQKSNDIAILFF